MFSKAKFSFIFYRTKVYCWLVHQVIENMHFKHWWLLKKPFVQNQIDKTQDFKRIWKFFGNINEKETLYILFLVQLVASSKTEHSLIFSQNLQTILHSNEYKSFGIFRLDSQILKINQDFFHCHLGDFVLNYFSPCKLGYVLNL